MSAKKIISLREGTEHFDEELFERLEILKHKLKFLDQRPEVGVVENINPYREISFDLAEILDLAGSKATSVETALDEFDPDILIFSLSGYSIEKMLSIVAATLMEDKWKKHKSVQNGKVFLLDPVLLGDTLQAQVEAAEVLAEIIHPKQFNFGFEGNGWINYSI